MPDPIAEQKATIERIASYHNDEGRKHNYNWIRTCVTILTPSLALLIGLQDNDLSGSCVARYLLVSAIGMMTITILLGLLALHSEAKQHVLSRNEVVQRHNEGLPFHEIEKIRISLPMPYLIALDYFPYSFWVSTLLLGIFGVLKYVI